MKTLCNKSTGNTLPMFLQQTQYIYHLLHFYLHHVVHLVMGYNRVIDLVSDKKKVIASHFDMFLLHAGNT